MEKVIKQLYNGGYMTVLLKSRLLVGLSLFAVVLVALVLVGVFFGMAGNSSVAAPLPESVEFGITALSPKGEAGGVIIPASCPSYEHNPGDCGPPSFTGEGSNGSGPGSAITITGPGGGGGGGGGGGDTVTLVWSCVNSSSSAGVNFNTGGATSGSVVEAPTDDIVYTVICSNGGQSSVTVTVIDAGLSIVASPDRIRAGDATVITWSATNVLPGTCQVTGPSGVFGTGESGSKDTASLFNQSTYTLGCDTSGGPVNASVVVTVIPSFEEI